VVCSRSALRDAFEGLGPAGVRDFFRDEVDDVAVVSLSRRSGGRGPVRVRPSWVSEAFLKVMRWPSGLVH